MCRGIFRLPWREKPGAHCDANVEEKTGNERDWERKKKTSLKEASPPFFLFHYWSELIWLKINPAGLRSDRVASTDDRTGRSVTSDAARIIQPVFIYVEIELLSAKSSESVAVSCQLSRDAKTRLRLRTDGCDYVKQTAGFCVDFMLNILVMLMFHTRKKMTPLIDMTVFIFACHRSFFFSTAGV